MVWQSGTSLLRLSWFDSLVPAYWDCPGLTVWYQLTEIVLVWQSGTSLLRLSWFDSLVPAYWDCRAVQAAIKTSSVVLLFHQKSHNSKINCQWQLILIDWSKQVHGMWYFPFSALTLLLGWQEGHLTCKKLDVGLLVVMIWLELCTSYSSSCHHYLHHPLLQ